jgi:hypothetical protein
MILLFYTKGGVLLNSKVTRLAATIRLLKAFLAGILVYE